jgi:hypothetical protein
MRKVFVIGAGNLGSRHIQSLCQVDEALELDIIDPSHHSLELARERVREVVSATRHTIRYLNSMVEMNDNYFFGVIATTANVRMAIIERLIEVSRVKFLLLEKVLFQKSSDLDRANQLLFTAGITAWVNCPRRLFQYYKEVRDELSGLHINHVNVSGGSWALACNAIHFIDIIEWLTGSVVSNLNTEGILNEVFPSVRKNYIEFMGALKGHLASGASFTISCTADKEDIKVEVICSEGSVQINESQKIMTFAINEKKGLTVSIDLLLQSQMTRMVYDELSNRSHCDLTPFENSLRYHKVFLDEMTKKFDGITGQKSLYLPIT